MFPKDSLAAAFFLRGLVIHFPDLLLSLAAVGKTLIIL